MLLSAWKRLVETARRPRPVRFRPQLLRLEERAVPATVTIHVGPAADFMTFSPKSQTIHVGDTVHWIWDTDNHSTTSGTTASDGIWDSGVHNAGFTFDHVFNQVGTFPYFCTIHRLDGMTGTIVVQAATTTTTPPTETPTTTPTETPSGATPVLTIGDVRTVEGQSGTHVVRFQVRLLQASSSTVTVKYSTASGSARAGSDFLSAHGTITFRPGETRKTVSVTIKGDRLVEKNETFLVNLASPHGATLARRRATGTIRNDDVVRQQTAHLDDAMLTALVEAERHTHHHGG